VSLTFLVTSLVALILMFEYYAGAGCDLQKFFISFTLILTLAFTGLSVTSHIAHGALLPSAVVTFYCYYLLYSALSSDPSACNVTNRNDTLHLVVGLLFGAASICYAGWSLANAGEDNKPSGSSEEKEDGVEFQKVETGGDEESGEGDEGKTKRMVRVRQDPAAAEESAEEALIQSKRAGKFHFVMAASAMYMAMLLTSWGSRQEVEATDSGAPPPTVAYDLNIESMWIKMGTQWATVVLYVWTLIAPYVCASRFAENA